MGDEEFLLLARDLLHGEPDRGDRHVEDQVDLLDVVPPRRNLRADIGLELMMGGDHFDRNARDLAAEILDSHPRRQDRTLAGGVGRRPGKIGQHADLHHIVGNLRLGERRQQRRRCDCRKPFQSWRHHLTSALPYLSRPTAKAGRVSFALAWKQTRRLVAATLARRSRNGNRFGAGSAAGTAAGCLDENWTCLQFLCTPGMADPNDASLNICNLNTDRNRWSRCKRTRFRISSGTSSSGPAARPRRGAASPNIWSGPISPGTTATGWSGCRGTCR